MDIQTFRESISQATPPDGIDPALQALWQEAKGNWDAAHQLAQAQNDATGAWVHAYCTGSRATSPMPVTGTAARERRRRPRC